MADEVTSGEIRTRQFDVVRKGYDRNQVETFLAQVARRFDLFEDRTEQSAGRDVALGIEDAEARGRELATIGDELDAILEAARSAAEGLRSRAAADVDEWTSEAKTFVEDSTSEAKSQANATRGAAWDEGSAMLAAAMDEAGRLVVGAETDALRIRAEAEREAIRYTTDAKRASEETIGAAESESEAIVASSRAESERLLRQANQAAELAQERARALEDRRAELVSELETTRSSIGDLETEIESKRQALEVPEPVAAPPYEERSHHETDSGSVRIVSGTKAVPFTSVDADSFVAEVEEMRRTRPAEESHQREESRQPSAISHQQTPDARRQTPDAERAPDSSLPQLAGGDVEERDRGGSWLQTPDTRRQKPEEGPVVVEAPVDPIGSLFAQLREDSRQQAAVSKQPEQSSQLTVDSSQSEEDPQFTVDSSKSDNGQRTTENASLIPVQNAALRSIKRLLVDLQNDALEHLRTDEAWVPEEDFTDRFSEPFGDLARAIDDDGDDGGASSVFATDLYDAVSSAVIAAREAGSGDRSIAAATSRVFRMWRSDEAERRVVAVTSNLSERS